MTLADVPTHNFSTHLNPSALATTPNTPSKPTDNHRRALRAPTRQHRPHLLDMPIHAAAGRLYRTCLTAPDRRADFMTGRRNRAILAEAIDVTLPVSALRLTVPSQDDYPLPT